MQLKHCGYSRELLFCVKKRAIPIYLIVVVLVGIGCFGKATVGIADIGEDRNVHSDTADLMLGEAKQEHSNGQKITLSKTSFEHFKDFIIHVKDDTSNGVLVCNVVLELGAGTISTQNRFELRKIIYRTLTELKIRFSSLLNAREQLKKEIKVRLNRFIGNDVITDVYITKFILL